MRGFWRVFPLFFSAPLAAALLFGLVKAFARPEGALVPAAPAASPWRPPAGGTLVLALGDSLTRGRGDEKGEGYVGVVAKSLRRDHPRLEVENLAVDGLESEGLKEILSQPNVRALTGGAAAILVSIGGNDLSHSLAPQAASAAAGVSAARQRFEGNLEEILSRLRAGNASAPILVLTLYVPSAAARPRGDPSALAELGSEVVIDWNAAIERIAVRHEARAIPVRDIFEGHPDRLSPDRFHPNAKGYELVGERALEALRP
jgi:lysophospholipase L1-like esterase